MINSENFQDSSVCILGLGYVGLTLSVALADAGFHVIGIEIRDDILASLKEGGAHFHEPGLGQKLRQAQKSGHFQVAKNIPENDNSTVYIITVGTPLNSEGKPRMDMVESVSSEVSEVLKDDDLVIMRSTVKIGTTQNVVIPLLKESGKKFHIAFCPERTLEGQAINELFRLPQIVGGYNAESTIRASQLFQILTPIVVKVNNLETAEMIKLVDNSSRDVAFAFSNEVARMCDAVGVCAAEVVSAGKLGYSRTNLPMPGPVGGPCLEKDSYILADSVAKYGIKPEIVLASRMVNERQPIEIVSFLKARLDNLDLDGKNVKISILGLAFKGRPETDDLRGTMAKPLIQELRRNFPESKVHGFDPVVKKQGIESMGVEAEESLEAAFSNADLVIIMNNHSLFSGMPIEELAGGMSKPGIIYDFWNFFNPEKLHLPERIAFYALGNQGND